MDLKCPKCGSTEAFNAHQVCYIDVVVDTYGTFVSNLCESTDESIYDSGKPYGPYTCQKCRVTFDIGWPMSRRTLKEI